MFYYAGDRESLKHRWKIALETGATLVEEIKIPFSEEKEYQAVKSMYLNKTIRNLLTTLDSGLAGFGLGNFQGLGRAARNIRSLQDIYVVLAILGTIGMIIYGKLAFKTLRLYFRYRDISKDIQQIVDVLLNSLIKAGVIHTDNSKLKVETTVDNTGAVY